MPQVPQGGHGADDLVGVGGYLTRLHRPPVSEAEITSRCADPAPSLISPSVGPTMRIPSNSRMDSTLFLPAIPTPDVSQQSIGLCRTRRFPNTP